MLFRSTNEVGVDGTIRFLRNVTGFWLLQECVRSWTLSAGGRSTVDLDLLTRAAARLTPLRAVVDVQDPAFAEPGDMPRRIAAAAVGEDVVSPPEVVRCVLDSMALAVRQAVHDACRLAGRAVRVIHLVGGGVANEVFCQLVADATQLPVVAGPAEAACWGNALTQARALSAVPPTLPGTRALLRHTLHLRTYHPAGAPAGWQAAAGRLADHRG